MRIDIASRQHLLLAAAPPLFLTAVLFTLQHNSIHVVSHNALRLFTRSEEAQCPIDLTSNDACALVADLCTDFDNDGLIPYLRIYTCAFAWARPIVLFVMALWLLVLFGSMAVTASEFLAIHLEVIVGTLGISENLAGVTIFAFGNGCTDLFSTLAAMDANSGSLAISELFGAAAFITTVVLGLITLIQPFTVDPRVFVGDTVWFIIAASSLVALLADGRLVLGECLGIVGLYVAFVVFAILRPKAHPRSPTPRRASETVQDDSQGDGSADNPLLEPQSAAAHIRDGGHYDTAAPISSSSTAAPTSLSTEPDNYVVQDLAEEDMNDNAVDQPLLMSRDMAEDSDSLDAELVESLPEALTARATDHERSFWENFPPIQSWNDQSNGEKLLNIFSFPLLLPIGLTIPPHLEKVDDLVRSAASAVYSNSALPSPRRLSCWERWSSDSIPSLRHWRIPRLAHSAVHQILYLQLVLGPQLFSLVVLSQSTTSVSASTLVMGSFVALLASASIIAYVVSSGEAERSSPRCRLSISILAFTISLVWIYLTATSAVTLLRTLALILDIPTALLGATVFAVGQSSNDLVANTAVARRGMPVLAASATFGGPMMNMLIGIGGGSLVQVLKAEANGKKAVFSFQTAPGLFLSAACLLLGLVVTLIFAFWNSWRLDGRLGGLLIAIWVVFTTANVAWSVTV